MATDGLPPETKTPALPAPDDPAFGNAAKELLEVREGLRGNPLDRNVTFRDLVDAGLAAPNPRRANRGRQSGGRLILPGAGRGPNLTVPPKPEGVVAVGAMTTIMLRWNAPGYPNHAFAEILRADVNDIGQAAVIGMSSGTQYPDPVGEGATKWYWVRFVTTSSVRGPASVAVQGKTTLNPEYVMAHLLSRTWQPDTAYVQFQYVRPTEDNGFLYLCTDPGISAGTEPIWPTTVYDEVSDGGVTWVCVPATERVPFMIGTVNGEPAVVMDTAFINDASISVAKIKDAFLDNLTAAHGTLAFARIEKGNIFELTIGGVIKSDDYSPGSSFCIAPGEPGYVDGDGWIIRKSRGSAAYIAEFYGDTLFSGDLRASRVLAPMLVGSKYGITSDADNCTFEYVCVFGTVADIVYGERSDPYINYPTQVINFPNSSGVPIPGITTVNIACVSLDAAYRLIERPFAGIKAGVQPLTWAGGDTSIYYGIPGIFPGFSVISSLEAWVGQGVYNQASIRTNPLNIIAYNAEAPRNYNRYRHRDIPCRFTFTRDSAASMSPVHSSMLRFRVMKGNTNTVAGELILGYSMNTFGTATVFVVRLNGTDHSYSETFTSSTSGLATRRYVIDNPDIRADFTIKDVLVAGRVRQVFLKGGYIELRRVPFSFSQPQGVSAIVDTVRTGMFGVFPGEVGLDIGFSLSSAMDNTV